MNAMFNRLINPNLTNDSTSYSKIL